jgi:carbon storage regulator CsrA
MLVLRRWPGEAIPLTLADGRQIRVEVVDRTEGQVRLGIDAPDDVRIAREAAPQ